MEMKKRKRGRLRGGDKITQDRRAVAGERVKQHRRKPRRIERKRDEEWDRERGGKRKGTTRGRDRERDVRSKHITLLVSLSVGSIY